MSRDDKHGFIALACFLAALAVLTFQSGCGASARQSALKGAYATVRAAEVGWDAYDAAHRKALIAAAPSEAKAIEVTERWYVERQPVKEALIAAYSLIGAAFSNERISLASVLPAVTAVHRVIETLRGRGP